MDFRVFPEVKSQLRGIRFASKQELTVAAKRIVSFFDADWYKDTFDKWISRHIKCIRVGDAFKLTLYGDSSITVGDRITQLTYLRPNSFLDGTEIRQLTISANNLKILYPFIFQNVPLVENLALQNNNISHISAASFQGLDNLLELRLSDNTLQSLSPNIFNSLTRLEFLFLNGNKLSAIHHNVLQSLKSLKHIDLSRNDFRTLTDTVFDGATNLEELLLNENQIWNINARWFKQLNSLRRLELRANAITRIDPSTFETVFNLITLSLSANSINSIANGAFKNLSLLQDLNIGTNDIRTLEPACFVGLKTLTTLTLSDNKLSFINNITFTATPNLKQLFLSKNVISDIEEAALHPLDTLEELDISYNKLKIIRSKTFRGLLNLMSLNLEHNIISEIENDAFIVAPLNQLSKLTWLSLQYNNLKAIDSYALFGLPHLKFLNLGHNAIKYIHKKSFYTLSSLHNLLLNDNNIRAFEDSTFVNLKNLFSMNLDNNKVATVQDNTFIGLVNLRDMNFVFNGLEHITPNAFRHFVNLETLKLQKNLLPTFNFSDLVMSKKLSLVDFTGNRLFELSFPKEKNQDIRQLVLSENQIQTMSPEIVNVVAHGGNVWLNDNPLSCDCRLSWLHEYTRNLYKFRLLGSSKTFCSSPASYYGIKVTDVISNKLTCDNSTVAKTLTCQNLQIMYTARGQEEAVKKFKKEARSWHVTLKGVHKVSNTTRTCYGTLLTDDWVITRQSCAKDFLPFNSSSVVLKIGRKESRDILLSVDFDSDVSVADFDVRLVKLVPKSRDHSTVIPCILSHAQFYHLSRVLSTAVFTTRLYQNETQKWRLSAKRGKLLRRCDHSSDICVRFRFPNGSENTNIQGSPLSLNYQGVWYLAGLGDSRNTTQNAIQTFTPLWSVSNWIANTIYEVDTKCKLHKRKNQPMSGQCEELALQGTLYSDRILSV
ncbi:hypothetical protein DPMN_187244 [Dreissena polymorpha]|uniref:LRRCT domain-containing protein n=1 Tax=Dreissena polymorpha TaxID=45954 RepID=A0A9D4DP42_DREPO|nr:hypothetical protein DPMN_187244 [Dreissena polymorpha]